MTVTARSATLGMVLTELGPEARLVLGSDDDLAIQVDGTSVVTDSEVPPEPGTALICADVRSAQQITALAGRLSGPRTLLFTSPIPVATSELKRLLSGHHVVEVGGTVNPASVVLSIARMVEAQDETVTRRLATLQRSLTQVLSEPDPVVALLSRLKSTCNATIAIVDKRGHAAHSTGPVPLSLLFGEISQTAADSQMLALDGWRGIADRIHVAGQAGEHVGWLVAIARRPDFPDPYAVSAVHVAVALVEASHQMTTVARQQEHAIRAAVLEEALALRRIPEDPELAGRIASLGLSFSEELRIVVAQPLRTSLSARGRPALRDLFDRIGAAVESAGISALVSVHERYVLLLVQCPPSAVKRILVASDEALRRVTVGIGRRVRHVSDVATSYHDAQLAIHTLKRAPSGPRVMTYEDFDFATRLFSDIGIDRMTRWASDFLAPVIDRDPLLDGLVAYFEHGQNMNAAAESLNIHHNSLRYRLSKVEETLNLNLRDPAALSSLFLALAARDLERVQAAARPTASKGGRPARPSDVEAPRSPSEFAIPSLDNLGVVYGPGR